MSKLILECVCSSIHQDAGLESSLLPNASTMHDHRRHLVSNMYLQVRLGKTSSILAYRTLLQSRYYMHRPRDIYTQSPLTNTWNIVFLLSRSYLVRTIRTQASHIDTIPMHDAQGKKKTPWVCRTTPAAKVANSLESLNDQAIAMVANDVRRF